MSKLLINESPLQVLPSLAIKIGLNEAIFVQQLHYWLDKSTTFHNSRKWIYKTVKEWHLEFPFWSEATIKRVISSLKKQKIILIEKLDSNKNIRVNYYSIDYEELDSKGQNEPMHRVNMSQSKGQNEPMHRVKMSQCTRVRNNENQETTTEITTENKKNNKKKSKKDLKSFEVFENYKLKYPFLNFYDYKRLVEHLEKLNGSVSAVRITKNLNKLKLNKGRGFEFDEDGFKRAVDVFVNQDEYLGVWVEDKPKRQINQKAQKESPSARLRRIAERRVS